MNELCIRAGTCIADRYVVEGILGKGGLGVVLAVRDLVSGAPRALKVLKSKPGRDAATLARFSREARASMALHSDHIVRVLDAGTWRGAPFLVMERLVGTSLHAHLRDKRMSPRGAADIALQICIALAHAHARGIVHRDVTPANVFLARGPDKKTIVKLLDFGISKVGASLAGSDGTLTATGTLLGSPRYMSPEQIGDAKRVDTRTDIWALGALLYRTVSGIDAFRGSSMVSVVCAVLNQPYVSIASQGVAIAPAFEAAIARCLERSVAFRFANVADLAAALAPFASPEWAARVHEVRRILAASSVPAFADTQPLEEARSVAMLRAQRNFVTRRIKRPTTRHRWELAMTLLASVAVFSSTLAFLVSR
jgi:eukaryotic-like serine/threonine-protein kinase